jgi:putative ABC transport system permease protein
MQVDYVDDNTPLLFMDFYLDMEIDEDNVAENLADDLRRDFTIECNVTQLCGQSNTEGDIVPTVYHKNNVVSNVRMEYFSNNEEVITIDGVTLTKEDRSEIKYTDTLELVINIMNSLIDIITVALVAFTSLSLVVSTVMIGIIIYVSVIERIKEIGVIRSLGGRKKDVSHLFNAESIIIGASSGIIGVGITYLLSFIANLIIRVNFDIQRIAILPVSYALIIILISMLLTSISGLIPAKMAAKKDPVNALRSE